MKFDSGLIYGAKRISVGTEQGIVLCRGKGFATLGLMLEQRIEFKNLNGLLLFDFVSRVDKNRIIVPLICQENLLSMNCQLSVTNQHRCCAYQKTTLTT